MAYYLILLRTIQEKYGLRSYDPFQNSKKQKFVSPLCPREVVPLDRDGNIGCDWFAR